MRFECLSDDFNQLVVGELMGLNQKPNQQLDRVNASAESQSSLKISRRQMAKILNAFHADFDLFGYDKEALLLPHICHRAFRERIWQDHQVICAVIMPFTYARSAPQCFC